MDYILKAPEISVCLTTFNRASILKFTIDSILNQSFQDFELIISNNCSTDETEEICLGYCDLDSRIIYSKNITNLGMPGNLNSAIKLARGKYIANIHDGDVYHPNLLLEWKLALDKNPSAGFVFNAYSERAANGGFRVYKENYCKLISGHELGKRLLSRWDSCVHGTVMSRARIYSELGGFDPAFGYLSDIDMWLRISLKYDVAYVNKVLIQLMPKDLNRFYGFVDWQVTFWLIAIHAVNLNRYRDYLPNFVQNRTVTFKKNIRFLFIRQMLICLKYKRFDLLKQIFCILKDSDDGFLSFFGYFAYDLKCTPKWYRPEFWTTFKIQDIRR
jgi:glycosyltransferase involved in cell wall biosynthesis